MLQKKERITKKSWQSRQQMLRENNEQKEIIKQSKSKESGEETGKDESIKQ